MKLLNLAAWLLPVVLPFAGNVLAEHSIPPQARHYLRRQDLARRAEGSDSAPLAKRLANVKWSFYDAETGNEGACGGHISNGEFAVAMNTAQFNQGDCGKTITLTWGGVSRQAVIRDMCPGCPYGGLDLTPGLWRQFADEGKGIIWDGAWSFGGAPEPTPTPTPTPEPTPTTTWTPPPPPPTTSSWVAPSSSWSEPASSSAPPSSSAAPSQAPSSASSSGEGPRPTAREGESTGALEGLNQAVLRFAMVAVGGAGAA
ncbi:hypothetical protein BKA70DRAFT_1555000 [Coprinopsis sp. MPI-PUGE-AT-0042]|nr:hypothetical protein BKA70DRAFT_1555000 [Coprinopsis sp. MPI-PUGE-AT-0042]